MGTKLIIIVLLISIILGYMAGFDELLGAWVIIGLITWGILKVLMTIFDNREG